MRFRQVCLTLAFSLASAFIGITPALAQQTPSQPPPQQSSNGGGIGFGVEVGMQKPSFYGVEQDLIEGDGGWMAGIWFGGNRNGRLGFMGELTYGVKNAHVQVLGVDMDLQQHFLEIPAVFRLNFGSRNREKFVGYFLVGPVIDIKLDAKLADLDVSDQYEGFDLGILGGAGVEVNRFGVEVRGNWGHRRYFDPSERPEEIKNFTLQVVGKFRIN